MMNTVECVSPRGSFAERRPSKSQQLYDILNDGGLSNSKRMSDVYVVALPLLMRLVTRCIPSVNMLKE